MEKINQIIDLLKSLANICVEKVDPERLFSVAEVLADYSLENLSKAIHEYKKVGKFFPAPVQIIELMKDSEDSPDQWFNHILQHVRKVGYYGTPPQLPDHVQRALENIGGYQTLCSTQDENLPFLASQFKKACSAFIEAKERNQLQLTPQESHNFLQDVKKKSGIDLLEE